jgi:prepilin-type N-terminal cleavage/methylation domain-containing protein
MNMKKNKKAFTIVELVIVIAVIAILMGIMFVGGTALNSNAKTAALDSDMRTMVVNYKAMVNEYMSAFASNGAAGSWKATDGYDGDTFLVALNKYFEDDMKLSESTTTFADIKNPVKTAITAVTRYTFKPEKKDPYGKDYEITAFDISNDNHSCIVMVFKSYGKNKLTKLDTDNKVEGIDADDSGKIVVVCDSVISTYDIDDTYHSKTYTQIAELLKTTLKLS